MRVLTTINNRLQVIECSQIVDIGNNTIVFWTNNNTDFATYNVFNTAGLILKAAETGFIDLSHYFTELSRREPVYVDNEGLGRELGYQETEEIDWREL